MKYVLPIFILWMVCCTLTGCAALGMDSMPVPEVAASVSAAPMDIVDGGLGVAETSLMALGGPFALVGMGVGYLRRRRRWQSLEASRGRRKGQVRGLQSSGSVGGSTVVNVYYDRIKEKK